MVEQIRMIDLLDDSVYERWISREPRLRSTHAPWPAWEVIARSTESGAWRRKVVEDYDEALDLMLKLVHKRGVWDAALMCRREQIPPPVIKRRTGRGIVRERWRRIPSGHNWCPHCRRPTLFIGKLTSHHAFTGHWLQGSLNPEVRRCMICGIPLKSIPKRWPDPESVYLRR